MKRIAFLLLFFNFQFSIFNLASAQRFDIDLRDSLKLHDYYVSVPVEDGNYRVSVTMGDKRRAGMTTVMAESRRLFFENEATRGR